MSHPRAFLALSMLENEYEPKLRRRSPYWRPRPAPCGREAHIPKWNWVHPEYSEDLGLWLTILDANGAFLAAASSATFAHGALEHTGSAIAPAKPWPGYYRIDSHAWSYPDIVSPLGSAQTEGKIWIAHPTLELLQQLERDGYWPEVRVHDSWTCPDSVRLREWATAVNLVRAAALRELADAYAVGTEQEQERAEEWYETVKTGYSMAIQLMRGPSEGGAVKSAVKRPDWNDTIHAQLSATTWRKVWRCVQAGINPVMMGAVDEVVFESTQFGELAAKGLLKLDQEGIQLGAFKVKETLQEVSV